MPHRGFRVGRADWDTRSAVVLLGIAAMAAVFFYIDIHLSRGTLDGYPYMLPLVGSIFLHARHAAFVVAAGPAVTAMTGWSLSDSTTGALDQQMPGAANLAIAVLGLIGTAAAIEHVRRLRARLASKLALALEAEEFRNRVMSIVAHDLRSPLNPIIGFASLLAESGDRLGHARVKEYGEAIAESSRRLLGTLDRLLEWARSAESSQAGAPTPTPLGELVFETVELIRPVADAKQVALCTRVGEEIVLCDPVAISTILRNLVGNAIKYSRPSSTVTIASLGCHDRVELSVADAGVGMSPSSVQRFSARKFMESQPGTMGEHGTGLGLRICAALAERNRCAMRIESAAGKGTTVAVDIPLDRRNVQMSAPSVAADNRTEATGKETAHG